MRNRFLILSSLFLSVIAVTLAYFKFEPCMSSGWISPNVYQHGCYSDITALYHSRGLSEDIWPYSSGKNSLEYPVLSGLGMWLLSLVVRNGATGLNQFYFVNILTIFLALFALIFFLNKFERKNSYLFALSPAVISALFINWDIWALLPMVISLYLLKEKKYSASAAILSMSIFLKFFPVILLIPMVFTLKDDKKSRNQFLKSFVLTSAVINVPFLLSSIQGWLKFYIFNYHRGVDYGSIWYLIALKGTWISQLNWIVTPLVISLTLIIYWRYRQELMGSIFLASVVFFTFNKVYSPQYVLWLAVIALLFFPKTKFFYILFAVWQGSEWLYQYGIWNHILNNRDQASGITANTYIAISAFRIVSFLILSGYGVYLLENNLIKRRGSKSNV